MSILNHARALALASLLAFCMGLALPAAQADARGYSKSSTASAGHTIGKKKYRSAKRGHKAYRHASSRKASGKKRYARANSQRRRFSSEAMRSHRMSLGASAIARTRKVHSPSRSSGNISWSASSGCLNGTLRSVIHQVANNYGSLRVNSTCRSASHNRRVGGATHSHHLGGNAVDFRVFGNVASVASFLRSHGSVGGFKHYGGGLFHIDTGPRRSW